MHAQVKTHVGAEALRRMELHPELDATHGTSRRWCPSRPEEVVSKKARRRAMLGLALVVAVGLWFGPKGEVPYPKTPEIRKFNDPVPVPNPAERAVRMAVAMRTA
jgi:hypothetical protein